MNNSSIKKDIAIIGVSGKFPKSDNIYEFWENIIEGKELSHFYTDEELINLGVPENELTIPNFIKVDSKINNPDFFDAPFFNYTNNEARVMDPQTRIFHQQIWGALEDAGYNPFDYPGKIGLFASASDNINWRVYTHLNKEENVNPFFLRLIADRNFITLLPSYKLNLRGPSIVIDSACSSSLVAVHHACRSLLLQECSLSIAGGIRISSIKNKGYFYEDGMIYSKDGHCKVFDLQASGTIDGEGVGVVILKRLSEAIRDRDNIYAIIKSSAINNDGNDKVAFTAPSVKGQIDCIKLAQRLSGVDVNSISYIEAHGTGTKLGDSIELRALTEVFGFNTDRKPIAIGSIKSNIGHLDAAAGIAGLIKTVLSIKNKKIPPSINFKTPNPEINIKNGPFYVNSHLNEWEREADTPRRAAVSSFGIGGTNAHLILEEAPTLQNYSDQRKFKLFTLSAKTENSLIKSVVDFKVFLAKNTQLNLSDLAFTLHVGREFFPIRLAFAYNDLNDLIALLNKESIKNQIVKNLDKRKIVFMFPGQGSQYINMGKDLYLNEPLFKEQMDKGFTILETLTGKKFDNILFPCNETSFNINQTIYTQPLIFLLEYSLSYLFKSIGILPNYLVGHSLGEYTAACVSGVIGFEDTLKLVVKRAELMNNLASGVMLSATLSKDKAKLFVRDGLSIAAINSSEQVVFSGNMAAMTLLENSLNEAEINYLRLQTSHAFHSSMLDSILDEFKLELEKIEFSTLNIPWVSNLTGDFISEDAARSVQYWLNHTRETVRFSENIEKLLTIEESLLFVEIGPGNTLGSLLKQQKSFKLSHVVVNTMTTSNNTINEMTYFTDSLAKIWSYGIDINWTIYHQGEMRRRISLPTYSFEPFRFPVEVNPFVNIPSDQLNKQITREKKITDWFYCSNWSRFFRHPGNEVSYLNRSVILFSDDQGVGIKLLNHFKTLAQNLVLVTIGDRFAKLDNNYFQLNPFDASSYNSLFLELKSSDIIVTNIFHLWNCKTDIDLLKSSNLNDEYFLNIGYFSLINIVRAHSAILLTAPLHIDVVSTGIYSVLGDEIKNPIKSTSLAPIKVIPVEFDQITCRLIDIDLSELSIQTLIQELQFNDYTSETAIRGKNRYRKNIEKIDFQQNDSNQLRKKGNYLITGATGAMGSLLTNYLVNEYQANLILIGRKEKNVEFLNELSGKGSNIIYIQSDLSTESIIKEQVIKFEKKHGAINGVIHTAGIGDLTGAILRRNDSDDKKVFLPKITGTLVLYSIFENANLDFFVNFSSQAAVLTPFGGEIAYIAANIYQDTFAEIINQKFPILSIQWTVLQDIGMAANFLKDLDVIERTKLLQYGIKPSEVVNVFLSTLLLKIPVQIVSPVDFMKVLSEYNLISAIQKEPSSFKELNKRPNLSTQFLAATTETEKKLALFFQDLSGIKDIGTNDSFLALGIDSLKSMMLLKMIKNEFDIDFTLPQLFENATIQKIGLIVDEICLLRIKKERVSKMII